MTHKINELDRLLRVRDIIKPNGILPICRSSFYNLIRAGVVPPGIRLGRTRLWKQSEIANLIN